MRVAMTVTERCNVRKIVLVISSFLAYATCERILVMGLCVVNSVVIDVGKGRKAP